MKLRTSPVASALRVGVCIVGIFCLFPEDTVRNMFTGVELQNVSNARISTAYALGGDRGWTSFSLPPMDRTIKIVTNAVAVAPPSREEGHEQQYSTRYQVTDVDGRVLIDRIYWQKARQREYFDPGTDKTVPSKFFVGEAGYPLPTRSFNLNLRGLPPGPLRLQTQQHTGPSTPRLPSSRTGWPWPRKR